MNTVRSQALSLLGRDDDELTDRELFAQQADDDFWYVGLCLEQLHRLPSEVNATLLCREYTELQAYQLVKRAMEALASEFATAKPGRAFFEGT
jgi:hypothetical protein